MQDRWLALQINRVVLPIFARGLLTKRQSQIVWAVISDSWAHYRRGADPSEFNWTRDPMPVSRICRITGLDHAHASRELRGMVKVGILTPASRLSDHEIVLSFNEHFKSWDVPKQHVGGAETALVPKRHMCRNGTSDVPKEHRIGAETAPPHIIALPKNHQVQEQQQPQQRKSRGQTVKRKKRAPTAAELAFLSGFKNRYGHEPAIRREHAIKLAERVGKDGIEIVIAKVGAWWDSPAGNWADAKGTRGIGAFLHTFDDIVVNGSGSHRRAGGPDLSRFERADKIARERALNAAAMGGGEPPGVLEGVLGDGRDTPETPAGGAEADGHAHGG